MNRLVVRSIRQLLTMGDPGVTDVGATPEALLGLVEDGAIVVEDGKFVWVGREGELPGEFLAGAETRDAGGRVIMPGLVECHSHLIHAGSRAAEFEKRCGGLSYEEIARAGGGIASTVKATRESGWDALFTSGMARLDDFLRQGVTTVEVKSGYGLDLETELKMLETARSLRARHPVHVVPTFLGAHVVPPEMRSDRAKYVDLVCHEMIPEVASRGLAVFCDVFCEAGAFDLDESRRVLEAGLAHGLVPKVHAEQLTHSGGALLAAELGAASADHLDHATGEDAAAMASKGVAAVFLPTATFFLGKSKFPDGRAFVAAGTEIAVSTDYNPGSSNTRNLWLAATIACTHCGLTPDRALRAITVGGAKALRLNQSAGIIATGRAADFIMLSHTDWREILYNFGDSPVLETWVGGQSFSSRLTASSGTLP